MEITEDYEVARSQRLREFNLVAKTLLSRDERQILYTVLKDYKRRHDVRRLVQGLQLVFQNNRKIELLKYVRYFLTDNHVTEFDRLTNFHMRFRLRRKRRRKRPKLLDGSCSILFKPSHEKTNNLGLTRSDTNRSVQSQKKARGLKFWI